MLVNSKSQQQSIIKRAEKISDSWTSDIVIEQEWKI